MRLPHWSLIALVSIVAAFAACSSDSTGAVTACPTTKPDEGSTCTDATLNHCTYLIQTCPCGPSDIEWTCACTSGTWTCSRGYDCYPCNGGVDQGTDQGADQGSDQGTDQGADQGSDQGIDMGPGPCAACKADEVCVQSFDGTCATSVTCKKVSATCLAKQGTPGGGCAADCEPEFCASPYQCQIQVPCGTEKPTVDIYCYGP